MLHVYALFRCNHALTVRILPALPFYIQFLSILVPITIPTRSTCKCPKSPLEIHLVVLLHCILVIVGETLCWGGLFLGSLLLEPHFPSIYIPKTQTFMLTSLENIKFANIYRINMRNCEKSLRKPIGVRLVDTHALLVLKLIFCMWENDLKNFEKSFGVNETAFQTENYINLLQIIFSLRPYMSVYFLSLYPIDFVRRFLPCSRAGYTLPKPQQHHTRMVENINPPTLSNLCAVNSAPSLYRTTA